jgi:hypothetical protein
MENELPTRKSTKGTYRSLIEAYATGLVGSAFTYCREIPKIDISTEELDRLETYRNKTSEA